MKRIYRKRIYNMVERQNNICPEGELLTDKELEKLKLHNLHSDWPITRKVWVYSGDIFFSFGVRFATEFHNI